MARKKTAAPATDTLLVELLTEELPPKSLRQLGEAFADEVFNGLVQYQLKLRDFSGRRVFATPRRLAVLVPDVPAAAERRSNEVAGPSVTAPQEAVAGFAKKHGLAVSVLEQRDTPKGRVFVARVTIEGALLDKVLVEIVKEAVRKLPIPKVMRWGSGDAQFVRPVHGLVMMYGKRVVRGDVLGVSSGRTTLGHRFLSGGRIAIENADRYEASLASRGRVIAEFAERRERIRGELESSARGAKTVCDDALLDEITALVEWPAVYEGTFERDFLEVPPECLILSMQQHQKYVPLRDAKTGELLPRFLFVSNIEAKDPRGIIHGNERVLRARLSDAKFFYDQDCKERLESRVPRLANVVYHNKLGSQLDRVRRVRHLAEKIAGMLGMDPALAERAAWLSKADLLSGMVGEFPELQGVMGRYYALHDNEPKEVADAIEQHYRPRFAGEKLPENDVAVAVALADKLDSLAGLFGIGQQPTGEKDPYALRRAALGVIRILVERKLKLPLNELIDAAFDGFSKELGLGHAHTGLEIFILERLRGYLRDAGYSANEVESVLSKNPRRLDQVPNQLAAVRAFMDLPEAASLASANKRVANILKQAASKGESFGNANRNELTERAEIALLDSLSAASSKANALFDRGDYTGYLKAFSVLKASVDAFFDSVMVMVEQESLRRNRLALLADLRKKMNRVADISKLAVEK
jgi:glycyl-tRNA synthetase beta chain